MPNAKAGPSRLEQKLRAEITGDVFFDRFNRGRYATDASFYQVIPAGVVVPRTMDEALRALAIARDDGRIVTPRGGGTSQCGQTVNEGIVVDFSKHLNRIVSLDVAGRTCVVEPGIVLDDLNRQLKTHGLWFPVDVSTASRATIGGMAGNNSCGGRSLRYGTMRDNTIAIDAALADGTQARFAEVPRDLADVNAPDKARALFRHMLALGEREAAEIGDRFPKVQRRVGGYNLDALTPRNAANNLAHLLVGSEGTLAFSTRIELKLWPLIRNKVLGVCHFGSFYEAMDAAQHLVKLKPIAVELVDRTMIGLGRDIAMFRPVIAAAVRGDPDAILVVEFAEETVDANLAKLKLLSELMGDLGFSWTNEPRKWGGVVEISEPALQTAVADFRAAGLNVMMSMKEAGKPVSFVEDCAVPLPHLADYTARLNEVFARHGTRGTMYAHASEGCLHVRPVLNLKLEKDVKAMRAIAEEAFAMVREYKGSHSGEHGDGIVRSEFHEQMFGSRIVADFKEVKQRFDPANVLNPGRIVDPPRMDDRSLFRYPPDYRIDDIKTVLDWSAYPGAAGGFQGAVEMCNNNGACRKLDGGVMCPSYRATRNEKDVTRGRANTLRLAISGQLGPGALSSDEMMETLKLCVSCKACRRECPTGVDMAKMKIEVLAARATSHGLTLRDRIVAYLPRYADLAARFAPLANLRNHSAPLRALMERVAGISAKRKLPAFRSDTFRVDAEAFGPENGREVVLFGDTFNRIYERENLDAALRVLIAGGYRVYVPRPVDGGRALCCGRTFLSAGLVDEAKSELQRLVETYAPFAARGVPIIGLEPSCLLTLRDELLSLRNDANARTISAHALLLEEFLAREAESGRLALPLGPLPGKALLHGHCHQKSFAAFKPVEQVLRLIPELEVETIESSCCGMAGAFGYGAETYEASLQMAEASLLPAVRKADSTTFIVADGTSCRHQIQDGAARGAVHAAQLLAMSLERTQASQ
ncbi:MULTISPECIES: FAD-binding and (Fe-S)-binding domain-containing protein [Bradyrhizobium]|jgi:FAD/FMN-containing dehydrogenase/Fe-S oxidoreductase|uniref:FAD-binding protein n=4 Tax=Bradyrhizobium TaxID=374 RepID=A0ABS5G794_9BRAD|nr:MULTISPECIES: FAD-binding and (Fe-S)-binding domain-containing protein [Bradyrhizobium]MBR1137182.1 FAD-binding protein [Bradyrhizobium denitrificans]MDU1491689.1 FAD-linked oxidase C-terminal domain-containing protein [Bradyrhizobium sp.]MDU1542397.1 FAD-linked oxidase C-terminal domain-containing protein [Bradyrhizobium sp.]MDU1688845.1 FAD-linked oxidase C-terminal domain-containing protein [Bradyrhizobium sp.]MDU1808363.1 FAD-linked oxidase C-terminal domain-containing protein [Bradyrhi